MPLILFGSNNNIEMQELGII